MTTAIRSPGPASPARRALALGRAQGPLAAPALKPAFARACTAFGHPPDAP